MAEDRRPQGRGSNPSAGGNSRGAGRPQGGRGKPGERSGKPGERSGKPGERYSKPGERSGKPGDRFNKAGERTSGGERRGDWKGRANPDRRTDEERSADQQRYDGPDLPEHITGKELDRSVLAQLKSLPEKLGLRVARHLAAAGEVIDSDPKTAYEHTLAARARASRLAVVREAVGEAAYAAGEYAEALAELKAAKRMNGAFDYVAIIADCERALKKPERALAFIKAVPREKLSQELNAELTIVEAGARRDRGEMDAALRTLENARITSKSREPWVARLRYAYADTLEQAGQLNEALTWFHRTEAVDTEEATDAGERAAALEKRIG